MSARGLITFEEVRQAFKAESVLKKAKHDAKLVVPPPEFRKGCDLAVEFNINELVNIKRTLATNKIKYSDIISIDAATTKTLEVVKVFDFGDSIMVRCGALKITFEKGTGLIRNISGGGCPDVPYLYIELVGKKLTEAPKPRDIGFTLCALCLDRAYEEAVKLYESSHSGHSTN
ncbi:MAG: DUF3343 domain-containing protein [Nitrososphaerales archaeon]